MTPDRVIADPAAFKREWSPVEVSQVENQLDQFFAQNADWDNAVREMGLAYEKGPVYALLKITSGDFYVEAGVRMESFALTKEGQVILCACDDDQDRPSHLFYGMF
ncbi:hypothetical protein LLE49_27475 [Alicyclobacillus tolerans]|uniref:hypothetical protein n=1 Tax=Alicyclobacillus tolerans TaxID=90970 RepID=UPI001F2EF17D|nr:hypothetical protein [Alicyclobacillus tolerans]MCF8568463.1 hypothetical protein [Alicyclobacillus tolerans]